MEEKIGQKNNMKSFSKGFFLFFSFLFFGFFLSHLLLADQSAYRKNEQGNKLYGEEKYQEALKKYTEAQLSLPESLELHYNIGNVLYRQGKFDEAAEEYAKSSFSNRKDLKAYSYFNRGNAQFMKHDFQSAIHSYIEALKINPDDRDAKKNLELALQKLEESQKSEQGQHQKQPKQKEKRKSPESESQKRESSPKQKPEGEQKKQDKELGQRLLEAIEEQEKEALKKSLLRGQKEKEKAIEKDW